MRYIVSFLYSLLTCLTAVPLIVGHLKTCVQYTIYVGVLHTGLQKSSHFAILKCFCCNPMVVKDYLTYTGDVPKSEKMSACCLGRFDFTYLVTETEKGASSRDLRPKNGDFLKVFLVPREISHARRP